MKQTFLFVSFILICTNMLAQVKPAAVPAKKIIEKEQTSNTLTSIIEKKSTITGNIEGFGNDTVFVRKVDASNPNISQTDTVMAKKGGFIVSFTHSETLICMIHTTNCFVKRQNGRNYLPETKFAKVFVVPGSHLVLSGKLNDKALAYISKGDELNETYSNRRTSSLKINVELINQMLSIDSMETVGVDESTINKFGKEFNKKQVENLASEREFIKSNPTKDLSAVYITNLPLDSIPSFIEVLDVKVKNGIFSKLLKNLTDKYESSKKIAEAQKKVVEGSSAPEFELKSLNGSIVKLSDFKDKYLVIDFWGSWCYWCIKGIPQMKEYYGKYKDKVEFIGIACRDKDEAWRAAIKKDSLDWVQLFNLTGSDVPVLYGVTGYPTKFILDKDHKVVFKVIGEDPIFYKKLDELLGK